MPADDGLWLEELRETAIEHAKYQAIDFAKDRPLRRAGGEERGLRLARPPATGTARLERTEELAHRADSIRGMTSAVEFPVGTSAQVMAGPHGIAGRAATTPSAS
jgi:hypothetical protein